MAIRPRVLPPPVMFDADREPGAQDDGTAIGATVFSWWAFDGRFWLCLDPARGAAVWLEIATFAPSVRSRMTARG
jgi:hypothetical protein